MCDKYRWQNKLKNANRLPTETLIPVKLTRLSSLIVPGNCFRDILLEGRLAKSRPFGERSEPCLAAKRPTASDEVARGRLVSLDGFAICILHHPAPYEIRRRTFLKVKSEGSVHDLTRLIKLIHPGPYQSVFKPTYT